MPSRIGRMNNKKNMIPTLTCSISGKDLSRLVTLLQSGFFRTTDDGTPFLAFLSSLPGFTQSYIHGDIGTLFLNGDAIDDFNLPLNGRAATIALSSAMPGLCGTILKKGSPHATLRKTRDTSTAAISGGTVLVKVKLFNTIALERGPELMRQGVRIKSADFLSFLSLRPGLLQAMHSLSLDGKAVSPEQLPDRLAAHPDIVLQTL